MTTEREMLEYAAKACQLTKHVSTQWRAAIRLCYALKLSAQGTLND